MAFTIHKAAAKKQMFWNISRPQEPVPADIPANWQGTPGQGLPVVQIPFYPFPCVVYLYPNSPTKTVIHRNQTHEIVHEEELATEALTMVVGCEVHKDGGPKECPDCNKALKAALEEGWQTTPYIPEPPANPDAGLYGPRKKNLLEEKKETKK